MTDDLRFQFTTHLTPEGEPVSVERAEELLQERLEERGGTCKETLWTLARLFSKTGRHQTGLEYLDRLSELTEDGEERAFIFLATGQMTEQLGEMSAAADYYRRALRMEPCATRTWYLIHNNLGFCLNAVGKFEEAEGYLKTAITIDPNRPNAFKNLGLNHVGKGRYRDAADCFVAATQAEAMDPRSIAHLEQLVEEHPELLEDDPTLGERIEACRRAVKMARTVQEDLDHA